jgi:hypothetical protein
METYVYSVQRRPSQLKRIKFMVLLIIAAFMGLGQVLMARPAQAASVCPPNDQDWSIPATVNGRQVGDPRCLNGTVLNTRSRLSKDCLVGVAALRNPLQPYVFGECNRRTLPSVTIEAEAIAQARLIAKLNERLVPVAERVSGGIYPGIQWETTYQSLGDDFVLTSWCTTRHRTSHRLG